MIKRTVCFLLLIILSMSIVGCKKTEPNDIPTEETVETKTVATPSESTPAIETTAPLGESELINSFIPLNQRPELPTGCEITSLTMVLNYYGFDADKCDLSDNYLLKGETGTVDFRKAFVGDPRIEENSFGCYAPVIVDTANKYLLAKNADMVAYDITNTELDDLFLYINEKIPVIVWGTLDCAEGEYTVTWNVDGQDLRWFRPEHCMVLVGYDEHQVWVADPMNGDIRAYERELFKRSYESLFKQAVVIREK
ncbi:MAG: C39 family peptidase [Ruminococcus sp.]|nr:C39 family peptidase [Ruminococcus sp.]